VGRIGALYRMLRFSYLPCPAQWEEQHEENLESLTLTKPRNIEQHEHSLELPTPENTQQDEQSLEFPTPENIQQHSLALTATENEEKLDSSQRHFLLR
jgi:hypothetical protein